MRRFKNIKTGNVIRVRSEESAKTYVASAQYEEVVVPAKKSAKAEKPTA